ncbi:hypothetical protein DFH08DRAFT_950746 [Mycena albidolilacea]|uniref:Uncharacterized protein n=1 Tax=Mycena albidolilacea TaxID=1033008 RepID=A0AAD7ALR7_9AGAR|nr:hypothetical protein DFH08DRAFT_950746 [Mycena albidolilacea]
MNSPPSSFNIIDGTLREGEQFTSTCFKTETQIAIARALPPTGHFYSLLPSTHTPPWGHSARRHLCVPPPPTHRCGERNGITPLGGPIAYLRRKSGDHQSKYNLHLLREIEDLIARVVQVKIPFMNPITHVVSPFTAF